MEHEKEDWLQVEPVIWKPTEAGDSIDGVLLLKRAKGGRYNKPSYVIASKEKRFLVFGTAVLENRMQLVEIEDHVRIVYKGVKKTQDDREVKLFDVLKRKVYSDDVVEESVGGE